MGLLLSRQAWGWCSFQREAAGYLLRGGCLHPCPRSSDLQMQEATGLWRHGKQKGGGDKSEASLGLGTREHGIRRREVSIYRKLAESYNFS